MTAVNVLDQFLGECAGEIDRRANLAGVKPVLADGAQAFRRALAAASPVEADITRVPVADHLDSSFEPAGLVPWVATPRSDDRGEHIALGLVNKVRDLGSLTCGLMLLTPGAAYPEHTHPPQEIYLPLQGAGEWRFGGSDTYRCLGADELVYNNPNDLHGAKATGEHPLLALYILWDSAS